MAFEFENYRRPKRPDARSSKFMIHAQLIAGSFMFSSCKTSMMIISNNDNIFGNVVISNTKWNRNFEIYINIDLNNTV